MTDETKTHYRKAFDSPYLSSADIVDPVVLTVRRVVLEKDRTKKTQDLFNTAYFMEPEIRHGEKLKPMILNATNSKMMASITGSKWIDDWNGVAVTIFVDSNVRFGKETVEGLRLAKATERPRSAPPELVERGREAAAMGVETYSTFWRDISKDERQMLVTRHMGWKAAAEAADKARAVELDAAGVQTCLPSTPLRRVRMNGSPSGAAG